MTKAIVRFVPKPPTVLKPRPGPPDTIPVKSYQRENLALLAGYERWLQTKNYSTNTCRSYLETVKDFVDFVGAANLLQVSHHAISQYLAYLYQRKTSSQTTRLRLAAIKSFFRFLCISDLIDFSPANLIRPKRYPGKLPRVLSEKETLRLLKAASNVRDQALLEVMYATGCRVGELVGMSVEDVDFAGHAIRVLGKGKKERLVLFGRPAAKVLKRHLGNRQSGFLFEGRKKDKPLTTRAVGNIVRSTGQRAGLSNVHCHLIRHSFATHLLNRGADLRCVQELLGHDSIKSTQIYTHLATADLARTIERCLPSGK